MQFLQLEVVSVIALSLSLQHLEDGGPKQQVCEVGQSQHYCPAHFDRDQLEPRHQPPPEQTQLTDTQTQKNWLMASEQTDDQCLDDVHRSQG